MILELSGWIIGLMVLPQIRDFEHRDTVRTRVQQGQLGLLVLALLLFHLGLLLVRSVNGRTAQRLRQSPSL